MSDQDKEKLVQQLKDALVAIRKLKSDLKDERERNREPLAIVGMSMRFPGGVRNAADYWELLAGGVDAISDIPADRFNARELYDPELSTKGKINVLQGGFIEDVDRFDSSFFDITPVEIESMDPQQRILLELTHEAMENAGLNVQKLVGSNTGVYVGIGSNDYQVRHFHSGDYNLVNPYSYTGSAGCAVAGRLSYMMGFQGPSMSIDTACSASIVAAHVGSSALRNRECDLAVIGGVNLMLSPEMTICFSNLQALSPDSRCKTFDNSANGYVRSEGSGIIVLKRLSDAQKDGDNIMAVIKGSASNQDGRSNGFTAPNVKAQIDLIYKALADAGLKPEDIDYIEAHGTGTKIGDPIEVEALTTVFHAHKSKDNPLLVGSVKSNIGHLESAAGMASMIKAVLSLQHKNIPQSIHYNEPNELINWESIPIEVPKSLTDFEQSDRNIGVSGFGITGTNGHIIIGETPSVEEADLVVKQTATGRKSGLHLLPLSAKSPEALAALAANCGKFINSSDSSVEDICAFTALRRAQFEDRKLFVASNQESLVAQLEEYARSNPSSGRKFDKDDAVRKVFVFSGQGAQWPKMGLALAEADDVFKNALEAGNESLKKYVDWDVFEELAKDEEATRMKEGDVMQPLLMTMGVALAKWWMSKGIKPDAVVGHSMGEIAAAHIAGHISLDEAARIVTSRSRLMEAQAGNGMMLATDLAVEDAEERVKAFGGRLSVSVLNSPSTTVIGGYTDAIDELMAQLESEERWCRRVRMTVAAHTAQMDPVLEPLRTELAELQPSDGPVLFYSSSQNREMKGSELDADYWVRNVRNSVQFGAAIRELAQKDNTAFIEIGPHSVLTAAIEENIMTVGKTDSAAVVSSIYRNKDEVQDLHNNLGEIYRYGLDIDWSSTHEPASEFVLLPNYPWQRERYWYDEEPAFRSAASSASQVGSPTFFQYDWEEIALTEEGKKRNILMVGNDQTVESILKGYGHNVESTGSGNLSLSEGKYDFILLLKTEDGSRDNAAQDLDRVIKPCLTLQQIVKTISDGGWSKVPKISLLTQGVFTKKGSEISPDTSGSLLWGMMRTLKNEYPELAGISIDSNNLNEVSIAQLIASGRNGEFYLEGVQILTSRLQSKSDPVKTKIEIRSSSCFLVTGGTSGLGLAFSEWLSSKGVRRIALVSRSGEKPETGEAIKRMSSNGAEVKIFKADVSDVTGVDELIASIEVSLGPITGVVHAAGLVDDGTISSLSEDQFRVVARPKVNGTWNLHKTLLKNQLTHFISFSSAATVLGTVGQANYNAANFYIDRLMDWRVQQGLPGTAVNWGNIGGVGMAAAQENRGERFKEMGFYPILQTEFDEYFSGVFNTADPQIIPMKMDFNLWAKHNPAMSSDPAFSRLIHMPSETPAVQVGQDWGNSLAAASRKIREMIKTNLSEITKISTAKVKEDETFKSMGLDSMMALQLKNKIQEATDHNLAVTSIWSHPTVEKYTAFLVGELELEKRFSGAEESVKAGFSAHQLKEMVKSGVSGITKIPANRIKESDTFKSMGIDSMQALQIKNTLQSQTGITLAASSIWSHPTVEKYTAFLAGQLGVGSNQDEDPVLPVVEEKVSNESIASEVEDLSLEELMKQLDDKSREH